MSRVEVAGLDVVLASSGWRVAALSGVYVTIEAGEVVGVVGESGAGKSMLAWAIGGILPSGAWSLGSVLVEGIEVVGADATTLASHRGRGVAMCFQNPRSSLNPVRTVGQQMRDRLGRRRAGQAEVESCLAAVGLTDPAAVAASYPHELSGGMAQRVMIALALACDPAVLIADEPTTGLDPTLTRAILDRFSAEARDRGRSVMIISHDLASIAAVCDRIVVLYSGTVVEEGPTAAVVHAPAHPYTQALIAAVPDVDGTPVVPLWGAMPALEHAPTACPFEPRCPVAIEACIANRPPLVIVGEHHRAACLLVDQARTVTP